MAELKTVLGPVPAADLGTTLALEHLHADFTREPGGPVTEIADAALDLAVLGEVALGAVNWQNLTLADGDLTAAELSRFAAVGGATVVDATPADLGRDPGALRRLARAAGLHVVMGSGWYRPPAPTTASRTDTENDPEALAAAIVADLTEGVTADDATDPAPVRAGVIGRLAALDPAAPADRALLTAAGLAQAVTAAPLYLEAGPLAQTLAAIDLVRQQAPAGRIAVAGCGALAPRPSDLERLAATDAYLLFDRIGRIGNVHRAWDDAHVIAALGALVAAGRGDRILLSPGIRERIDLIAYGGTGYGLIQGPYLPLLQMAGFGDDFLDRTLVTNTARFLAGQEVSHGSA